jgi:hypothetical protein
LEPATSVTRSYSYQGQDLFVLDACNFQTGGYFLDSGASTGVVGSNTKLLEAEYGWTGICVEPNELMYEQLARNRSCICLNVCLYDRDGWVDFFEVAEVYGGVLDDYAPAHLEFARRFVQDERGIPTEPLPTVRKAALSIRSVLRSCDSPRMVDYWSLDTEGSELLLLQSFPWDEYHVRVLTVEHNNTDMRERIHSVLEARGYERVRELGIDDGYVMAHPAPRSSWRSAAWRYRHR